MAAPRRALILSLALMPWLLPSGLPVSVTSQALADPPGGGSVIVTVNDTKIREGELQRFAMQVLKRKLADTESDLVLKRFLAQQLVVRELARQELAESEHGAPWKAAAAECGRQISLLKKNGITLTEFLAKAELNLDAWQREVHWRIAWKSYLEYYMTDENLQRYFKQHRRDFDGTKLHVAHLLLTKDSVEQPTVKKLLELAADIRKQIVDKQLSFADAVRKYSQAPSVDDGGDLGWIERHQPMPEAFSAVAFRTQVGQVSEPVVTKFGVHLIHVLEEKPGELTWEDVRSDVRKAVQEYLLNWLADRRRKTARIKWSAGWSND